MINKTPKQLERNFKGVANHRRIEVLLLLAKEDNVTLINMARALKCNFKTLSEHTKKLVYAGLLDKNNLGDGTVRHSLSPYGKKFVKFIESFNSETK